MENTKNKKRNVGILNKAIVKEELKGLKISKDYLTRLDKKVKEILRESMVRATANSRKTVLARDL